ncbi:helix-turn-helix domain-containing protein [Mesobacillus subterraneus]|uniref:DNA-binding protein n=1 Tax=Mesobacillus subterraneus TaxID=285983 RepID=A0A3R9F2F4_9BACI|nr:helix-turn-helix domain-containing protein [Mesobacillus subterraneus]RSD28395.1 DNA-binding protein [Mesobacillus subterraneus]
MKIEYGIVILSLCILVSGYWIGSALKKESRPPVSAGVEEVLTLTEASNYLGLSEEDIKKVISQEEEFLQTTGSFSGMMFPYTKVYDEYVFSKKSLDEWLEESTKNRKVYGADGIGN